MYQPRRRLRYTCLSGRTRPTNQKSKEAWQSAVLRAHGHAPQWHEIGTGWVQGPAPYTGRSICISTTCGTRRGRGGWRPVGRFTTSRKCSGIPTSARRTLTSMRVGWDCMSRCVDLRPRFASHLQARRRESTGHRATTKPANGPLDRATASGACKVQKAGHAARTYS